MANGVRQALLRDTVERCLDLRRDARASLQFVSGDLDTCCDTEPLLGVFRQPRERRDDAQIVQQRGAQLARDGLHLDERALRERVETFCLRPCAERGVGLFMRERLANSLGVKSKRCEALPGLVVQLQREAAALLLLRAQRQPGGLVAHLCQAI